MVNTSHSYDPAIEVLTVSKKKEHLGRRSGASELPNIITADRRLTKETIPEGAPLPVSQSDEEIIRVGEAKSHTKYKLPRPTLVDEDFEVDYERWKKRACCHQFSNEKLEDAFWIFYMDNHTWTIKVVFSCVTIIPFGWVIVDYLQLRDDMPVFWTLVYLRVLLFWILLVFLIFFFIGLRELENADVNENSERATNDRPSYMSMSSPRSMFTLTTDKAFDSTELKPKLKEDLSWYSRFGVLVVKYSCKSVFVLCFLISCIMISLSTVGEQPSHKPYIMWFIVIHIFCGLGNKASSLLCWITTVMFGVVSIHLKSPDSFKACTYVVVVSISLSVMGEFLEFSYRKLFFKRRQLELEQYWNDLMLTNVMPPRVALQLKRGEREAVTYEYKHPNWGASVLFCQICDFEELSNELSASALVNYLNKVFTNIDILCTRSKVYKVETVKEVYMAACGLPQPDANHMNQIAHFALDLKEVLIQNPKTLAIDDKPDMKSPTLKIGINCGTVIAGVIGKLCPRYRLFGDTVNVAARMETNSVKGKIQITEKFNSRIDQNAFITTKRGLVEIKGKNSMITYFLEGRKNRGAPDLSELTDEYNRLPMGTTTSEHLSRLSVMYNNGVSILDLCCKNNKLETLRTLLESPRARIDERKKKNIS